MSTSASKPNGDIPKQFDYKNIEGQWNATWEKKGVFSPKKSRSKKYFSLVTPLLRSKESLTLDDTASLVFDDAYTRFARMQGYETNMYQGIDALHLCKEELIGEEKCTLEECLDKKTKGVEEHVAAVAEQVLGLGVSSSREDVGHTLSPEYQKAVLDAFTTLYKKDYIYRGDHVVNWCPTCQTVVSDLETYQKEEEAKRYHIRYFVKAADKSIIITTTRPETILGDAAVAVHPEDKRYKEFTDKVMILPVLNKEIPVVIDKRIEMEDGSGAYKVTPAHDYFSYDLASDHKLEISSVIGTEGAMNPNAGKFSNLHVDQARQNIVEYLDNIGNLEEVEECVEKRQSCVYCDTPTECLLSTQWFVRIKPLAEKCIKAIEDGKVDLFPLRAKEEIIAYLENARDWCISRQNGYGYDIPVYYDKRGRVTISTKPVSNKNAVKEEDVLDPYFAHAIWPLAALGWPKRGSDVSDYYPTSLFIGHDDKKFAVVMRALLLGYGINGKFPFDQASIHGSVGIAVEDEMDLRKHTLQELKKRFPTDSIRLGMYIHEGIGNTIIINEDLLEDHKKFVNKLWNVARFIRLRSKKVASYKDIEAKLQKSYKKLNDSEKWVVSRIQTVVQQITEQLDQRNLEHSIRELHKYTQHEFADWALEVAKIDSNKHTEVVLQYCLMTILKLWHPFIPFVTEEMWSLYDQKDLLALSKWPKANTAYVDEKIEEDFFRLMDIVKRIKALREERGVDAGKEITMYIVTEEDNALLKDFSSVIKNLLRVKTLKIVKRAPDLSCKVTLYLDPYEVYLPLEDMIDVEAERSRIDLHIKDAKKQLELLNAKLDNPSFLQNAPSEAVEEKVQEKENYEAKLTKLLARLAEFD